MKRIIFGLIICAVMLVAAVFGVNGYVKTIGGKRIILPETAAAYNADCILVLGCGVRSDGSLSDMLADRVECGVELYKHGAAPKIIMSGDHGRIDYDEVNAMKQRAVELGVPAEDVFMDHAGFSTYESVYRAKEIFGAKRVIAVTQKYHLYRTLYTAERLGLETYGVSADYREYRGETIREVREILARCKDFLKVIAKPEPTYLGEMIPVSGDGNITND